MSTNSRRLSMYFIALLILLISAAVLFLLNREELTSTDGESISDFKSEETKNKPMEVEEDSSEEVVLWDFRENEWIPSSTPPNCPDPYLLDTPVDLENVISFLWPGQVRGGDFKSHGGFRFENSSRDHEVVAPVDMELYKASKYLESGEIQYFLVFSSSCGIIYKFDHIAVLGTELSGIDDVVALGGEGDSRTTLISPPISIKKGTIVGTKVGIGGNSFVDFGVHDARQRNQASKGTDFAKRYGNQQEFIFYGVCWLDLMSAENKEYLLSLEIATVEKTPSHYCDYLN